MALAIDTLAYAKRLREAGFTELQAEGQAQALAAAMTDSLATKQDLRELEARLDARFAQIVGDFGQVGSRFGQVDSRFEQVDARFDYLERHLDTRLAEQAARFDGKLSDLEHRLTLRLGGITVAGIGVVSALVKLL